MNQHSDAAPLDEELRAGLVPYVCDQDKFFLPNTTLDSILQYDKVYRILERFQFNKPGENSLLVYIQRRLITLLG